MKRLALLPLLGAILLSCSASGTDPSPEAPAGPEPAVEKGFRLIFDGKTLDGWKAPDMSFFSVVDGAITGEATPKHMPAINQFIVVTSRRIAQRRSDPASQKLSLLLGV
jgi:hypothetical protein